MPTLDLNRVTCARGPGFRAPTGPPGPATPHASSTLRADTAHWLVREKRP